MGQRVTTFAVPAGAAAFAPTSIVCRLDNAAGQVDQVREIEVHVESLPATATIEVEQLKIGGDPAVDADWLSKASFNAVGTQSLKQFADWPGVRVRGKSGGTAGDSVVHVAWRCNER